MTVTTSQQTEASKFARVLVPLLAKLITGIEPMSNSMANMENTVPVLSLVQEIIQLLEVREMDFDYESKIL